MGNNSVNELLPFCSIRKEEFFILRLGLFGHLLLIETLQCPSLTFHRCQDGRD